MSELEIIKMFSVIAEAAGEECACTFEQLSGQAPGECQPCRATAALSEIDKLIRHKYQLIQVKPGLLPPLRFKVGDYVRIKGKTIVPGLSLVRLERTLFTKGDVAQIDFVHEKSRYYIITPDYGATSYVFLDADLDPVNVEGEQR